MTQVFPARGLQLALASVDDPSSFSDLERVFVRRFSMHMQDEAVRAVAPYAWQVQSDIIEQFAEIEAELALSQDPAVLILREGALLAQGVMIQVTFPDGSLISGLYRVSDYEIFAEEGDILHVAFTARSRAALTLSLGG